MAILAIMGSGETAPVLVKTHRDLIARTPGVGGFVMLDTPFGFQRNADDLVAKTQAYFAQSVGTPVTVASWRSSNANALDREAAIAALGNATWAFAGPGSPSYALRMWQNTAIPEAIAAIVQRNGTLVMGSAAALTLGSHALPVYEIYKAGYDPHWLPGLNLLHTLTGIRAAVVPHNDNNEGGASHDTRFCYLGEERLTLLEAELPDGTGILGVDEHTCIIITTSPNQTATSTAQADASADQVIDGTVEVQGNGRMVLRTNGIEHTFTAGARLSVRELAAILSGHQQDVSGEPTALSDAPVSGSAVDSPTRPTTADDAIQLPSLRTDAENHARIFDHALNDNDTAAAANAIFGLLDAIDDWARDSDQNSDQAFAQQLVRSMIARLATSKSSVQPEKISPLIDWVLNQRAQARQARDYTMSDQIRDALSAIGIQVQDGPEGATWAFERD